MQNTHDIVAMCDKCDREERNLAERAADLANDANADLHEAWDIFVDLARDAGCGDNGSIYNKVIFAYE